MAKRYYWLKLSENFFQEKRIKKLRRLAGGDTYTIIYLKMQLLSMNNNGILVYEGIEPSFAEELALDLDENADNVQVTLSYLMSCGLVETSDNISFLIPEAVENTGSESESAERMRKHREKIQENQEKQVLESGEASHCDTDVTQRREDKRREEKKESKSIGAEAPTPAKAMKNKYGEYGWVICGQFHCIFCRTGSSPECLFFVQCGKLCKDRRSSVARKIPNGFNLYVSTEKISGHFYF